MAVEYSFNLPLHIPKMYWASQAWFPKRMDISMSDKHSPYICISNLASPLLNQRIGVAWFEFNRD